MSSCSVVFLFLSAIIMSASAETLSSEVFQMKGGKLGYIERNEVYSAWNPLNPAAVLKPGMKVIFFGRGEGCDVRAGNGPVKNQGNPRFGQTLGLTGISLAHDGKGQRWTPSADTEQCYKSVRDQVGDSFVHVNEDPINGGVGMFTFTGPDVTGRRSFFRQFDKSGRAGKGFNANIEGTFVSFRFDWQKGNTVRPWAGSSKSLDQRKAEFRTIQSVAAVSVEDKQLSKSEEPIQAKQQFIPAFINRTCFLGGGGKGMCQLQYLFNTAVIRSGVMNWDTVNWFKYGGVFLDQGQGGMPVVHGPISRRGEAVADAGSGFDLYTSQGEASQHAAFKDKEFRVQVSFSQLKNALVLIAAKSLNKSPSQVTDTDLASIIGPSWNDPDEWLLLSVNISQEVYNPRDDVRAYIGGSIKELEIISVSN